MEFAALGKYHPRQFVSNRNDRVWRTLWTLKRQFPARRLHFQHFPFLLPGVTIITKKKRNGSNFHVKLEIHIAWEVQYLRFSNLPHLPDIRKHKLCARRHRWIGRSSYYYWYWMFLMLVELEGICYCIVRRQSGLSGDDVHLMRLLRWKIARKLYLSHFTSSIVY